MGASVPQNNTGAGADRIHQSLQLTASRFLAVPATARSGVLKIHDLNVAILFRLADKSTVQSSPRRREG